MRFKILELIEKQVLIVVVSNKSICWNPSRQFLRTILWRGAYGTNFFEAEEIQNYDFYLQIVLKHIESILQPRRGSLEVYSFSIKLCSCNLIYMTIYFIKKNYTFRTFVISYLCIYILLKQWKKSWDLRNLWIWHIWLYIFFNKFVWISGPQDLIYTSIPKSRDLCDHWDLKSMFLDLTKKLK